MTPGGKGSPAGGAGGKDYFSVRLPVTTVTTGAVPAGPTTVAGATVNLKRPHPLNTEENTPPPLSSAPAASYQRHVQFASITTTSTIITNSTGTQLTTSTISSISGDSIGSGSSSGRLSAGSDGSASGDSVLSITSAGRSSGAAVPLGRPPFKPSVGGLGARNPSFTLSLSKTTSVSVPLSANQPMEITPDHLASLLAPPSPSSPTSVGSSSPSHASSGSSPLTKDAPVLGQTPSITVAPSSPTSPAPTTSSSHVLILDFRPQNAFSVSHITHSQNICIPTMMLKRASSTVSKMMGSLGGDSMKTNQGGVAREWYEWEWVVVYDGEEGGGGVARTVAGRMMDEVKGGKANGAEPRIALLQGGFASFKQNFPHLCEASAPSESTKRPRGMHLNLPPSNRPPNPFAAAAPPTPSLLGPLGPFTAPTILPSHLSHSQPYNPLAPNARPATNAAPSTPPYASHLAFGPSSRSAQELTSDAEDVVRKFRMVEEDEKRRLEMSLRCRSGEEMWSVSDGLEGGVRNRYNNIWPFNHNRVKLPKRNANDSDYINASHIRSPLEVVGLGTGSESDETPKSDVEEPRAPMADCASPMDTDRVDEKHRLSLGRGRKSRRNRSYIATQGPLPDTFEDFWRMIVSEDVNLILMLCSEDSRMTTASTPTSPSFNPFPHLRKNRSCDTYWPALHQTLDFPTITIACEDEEEVFGGEIVVRRFSVSPKKGLGSERKAWQVQYTKWPDHGVPEDPDAALRLHFVVESMRQHIRGPQSPQGNAMDVDEPQPVEKVHKKDPPMVVHCSAGCGRTGAYIVIEAAVEVLRSRGGEIGEFLTGGMAGEEKESSTPQPPMTPYPLPLMTPGLSFPAQTPFFTPMETPSLFQTEAGGFFPVTPGVVTSVAESGQGYPFGNTARTPFYTANVFAQTPGLGAHLGRDYMSIRPAPPQPAHHHSMPAPAPHTPVPQPPPHLAPQPQTSTSSTLPQDLVLTFTHHLRTQRLLMVQSVTQFKFCYDVVKRFGEVWWGKKLSVSEDIKGDEAVPMSVEGVDAPSHHGGVAMSKEPSAGGRDVYERIVGRGDVENVLRRVTGM